MSLRTEVKLLNEKHFNKLHPQVKAKFVQFSVDAENNDLDIKIIDSLRSYDTQAKAFAEYKAGKRSIPVARPGYSYHNYGCAIDVLVWDNTKQQFVRDYSLYKKLETYANKNDLYWLAKWKKSEMHHFEYKKVNIEKLKQLKDNGQTDAKGYPLLDAVVIENKNNTDKYKIEEVSTELGKANFEDKDEEKNIEKKTPPQTTVKIEEYNAVGIWQICKLVADQYSLSQNINDATMAFDQGSLLNFVKKVVQEPWLEFFGDTVNDQYFFQTRKQPFDLRGWRDDLASKNVYINDVVSDELSWYTGPVYSWYQIIPKGSFLGDQNQIFQHVAAVFFEEYAEVWGSKPLSVVSNYLNFVKQSDGKIMLEKAFEDLRYMVESNMYMPFTREGTITVKLDYSWKRGQKLNYLPSGEQFYIENVSHSWTMSDNGPIALTNLKVNRGMVMRYIHNPESDSDISYWNLILFSKPEDKTIEYNEDVPEKKTSVYFDNNRSYLIDLNESFDNSNDTASQKMQQQIKAIPTLRKKLSDYNVKSIENAADLLKEYPEGDMTCTGYVDVDFGGKTPILAKKRAETFRSEIIKKYIEKYKDRTEADLLSKINVVGAVNYVAGDEKIYEGGTLYDSVIGDNNDKLYKALERFSEFKIDKHVKKIKKVIPQEGIAWRVNDPVFQFFLKRKQQNDCVFDVKKYTDTINNLKNKPI